MTRPFWVTPTRRLDEVAGAALEAGADGVIVADDDTDQVEHVGRLPIATRTDQTVTFPQAEGRIVRIDDPEDQEAARALLGKVDILIVRTGDWTIIPLENLIAWAQESPTQLFAEVQTPEDAELALTTLETGVEGIVLATDKPATVHAAATHLSPTQDEALTLEPAQVDRIEDAGMGDRVCVDTTSLLNPEEGLLVGSQSGLLALVASEATEGGYVASRPFRVNAGAVHAYTLAPDGATRYLSEVQAGVPLLAVDRDGATRRVVTGRAKIERRPMLLIRVTIDGDAGTLVVQNAETIRLVTPEGLTSVAQLDPGDTVLVHRPEATGRHFGQAIDETIEER